jgi:peptidoglycan-N-acetylglucosamine deacetylase
MRYLVKTPWLIKRLLYPAFTWDLPTQEKTIYLSFDDGPHPEATPYALDQLKAFGAKGTFFCIGKNVEEYPAIYKRILDEGHVTGNHTQQHLNGWKSNKKDYISNIIQASGRIQSRLFRPPYGRIRRDQARELQDKLGFRIIMWSVLSGDFDPSLQPEACWGNIRSCAGPGDIIVFHDSEKAAPRMFYALPKVLEYFSEKGFRFEGIPG